MGMDAHIAFNSLRHKRMPCFPKRQIPTPMGIHCNQLKALCVRLWSWRRLSASQLHATGPWPSVAPGRLGSESVLVLYMFNFCPVSEQIWGAVSSECVLTANGWCVGTCCAVGCWPITKRHFLTGSKNNQSQQCFSGWLCPITNKKCSP